MRAVSIARTQAVQRATVELTIILLTTHVLHLNVQQDGGPTQQITSVKNVINIFQAILMTNHVQLVMEQHQLTVCLVSLVIF